MASRRFQLLDSMASVNRRPILTLRRGIGLVIRAATLQSSIRAFIHSRSLAKDGTPLAVGWH